MHITVDSDRLMDLSLLQVPALIIGVVGGVAGLVGVARGASDKATIASQERHTKSIENELEDEKRKTEKLQTQVKDLQLRLAVVERENVSLKTVIPATKEIIQVQKSIDDLAADEATRYIQLRLDIAGVGGE
jgi:septal ring factor EnvC (AmiA/AmiB activator)